MSGIAVTLNLVHDKLPHRHSQAIAQAGTHQLTYSDLEPLYAAMQFAAQGTLDSEEPAQIAAACAQDFAGAPLEMLDVLHRWRVLMLHLQRRPDVGLVAVARKDLLRSLLGATWYKKESRAVPLVQKMIDSIVKVVAVDDVVVDGKTKKRFVTNRDIMGMLHQMQFYWTMRGGNFQITPEGVAAYTQFVHDNFRNMSDEVQQMLCAASTNWQYANSILQRLTPAQLDQLRGQLAAQAVAPALQEAQPQWGAGTSTTLPPGWEQMTPQERQVLIMQRANRLQQTEFNYRMQQRVNLSSHVMQMNVLENIGDSGRQWYVSDSPSPW